MIGISRKRLKVRVEQERSARGVVGVGLELGVQWKVREAKRSVLRGGLWCGTEVCILAPA